MRNYGKKWYEKKSGLGAVMIGGLATLGVVYASGNCAAVSETINRDERTGYERFVDDYKELTQVDQMRFLDETWGTATIDQKTKIIGDDLGLKVKDLYELVNKE